MWGEAFQLARAQKNWRENRKDYCGVVVQLALGTAALAWGRASTSLSLTAVTNAAEAANRDPTVAARTAKGAAAAATRDAAEEEEVEVAYPRVIVVALTSEATTRCRGRTAAGVVPSAPAAAAAVEREPAMTRRPNVRAAERILFCVCVSEAVCVAGLWCSLGVASSSHTQQRWKWARVA